MTLIKVFTFKYPSDLESAYEEWRKANHSPKVKETHLIQGIRPTLVVVYEVLP